MPDRPPVTILACDFERIAAVASQAAFDQHPVAGFLLGELRRATVIDDGAMAADTVGLNEWVTFRADWGFAPETRLLVAPGDYRSARTHLSVLSPLGAALVGLRVGDRIGYRSIEGVPHMASVEALEAPLAPCAVDA